MKRLLVKGFVTFIGVVLIISHLNGCKKKSEQEDKRSPVSILKLTDRIKTIPLTDLLPPVSLTKRSGKLESEVPQKVKEEYTFGTLAGQYGKLPTAVEHIKKSLSMQPDFIDAHHNLGLAYYKMGRIEEAVGEWRTVLRLDPSYAETYYNLAMFLLDCSRTDDAIQLLNNCLQFDNYHLKARFALGKIYQQRGKNQEAMRHFKAFQLKDRGDLRVHLALGEIYLMEGQLDAAQKELEAAVRLDDKNPKSHYQLGVVYHRKGLPNHAIGQYQKATELSPDYLDAYVNMGDLFAWRHEYASSLAAFNSAIGISSQHPYAKKRAAEVEKILMDQREASARGETPKGNYIEKITQPKTAAPGAEKTNGS